MNTPDFTATFATQECHKECCYKYIVYLEDLNQGNMSLTNGIEIAVKKTIETLKVRFNEFDLYNSTFWFYKDSEDEYAQISFAGRAIEFKYLTKERAEKILALMKPDVMLDDAAISFQKDNCIE